MIIIIMSIFIIIMFSNGMFVLVPELMIFDVSSIIYGYLLIYVFYYMMYSVPQYLKKNLILINSENLTDAIICFDEKNKFTYCNKIAKEEGLEEANKIANSIIKNTYKTYLH